MLTHPNISLRTLRLLLAALLVPFLMGGCNTSDKWDKEYACDGQEQSSAYFVGDDPAGAIQKTYPLSIDFHIRAGNALVKGYLVANASSTDEALTFSATNTAFRVNGQFDKRNSHLDLVEQRTLDIAGRTQQIRTTGQFACTKVG
jgi:hypothetical protein